MEKGADLCLENETGLSAAAALRALLYVAMPFACLGPSK